MRKTALLVLCGIIAFAQLIAQTRNLSGKVTQEDRAFTKLTAGTAVGPKRVDRTKP